MFGSAGGVGVGGRPAGTKTGGERTVDDGGAAAVAEEHVGADDKIAETAAVSQKETLADLRGLVKEVHGDAWMWAKPRHAGR